VLIRLRRGILLGAGLRERVATRQQRPSRCDADQQAYGIDAWHDVSSEFPALLAETYHNVAKRARILGSAWIGGAQRYGTQHR